MFLLPWNEKFLHKDPKFSVGKAQTSAAIQFPLLNAAKRKLGDDEQASQTDDRPAKRRLEQITVQQDQSSKDMDGRESRPPLSENTNSPDPVVVGNRSDERLTTAHQPEKGKDDDRLEEEQTSQQQQAHLDSGVYGKLASRAVEADCAYINFNADPTDLTPLQQTIESQFSLEILLKHRGLRLIDQELAKCQIALEQLRRCRLMPFPATSDDPAISSMASSGTGPSYGSQAQHPPPWGVTDGPYTRHYAKWLLPDSTFDDDMLEDSPLRQAGKGLSGRASQGSKAQKGHRAPSSRGQRGSARERLQALPHGYPVAKENKGPMIVKRSTDGRMVKLVCLDCRREDFNSAQGFINHCRIAHNRGFASHDAAAIACGEEVEIGSAGDVVGEPGATPTNAGLVHPLIRSAHVKRTKPIMATATPSKPTTQLKSSDPQDLKFSYDGSNEVSKTPTSALTPSVPEFSSSRMFNPSPQTPHLSALFARSGRGGDLDEMVAEARRQPEPETPFPDETEDDEENLEDAPEEVEGRHTLGTRGVVRGGGRLPAHSGISPVSMGRSPSNKGTRTNIRAKPGHLHTALSDRPYAPIQTHSAIPESLTYFDHEPGGQNASPADSLPSLDLSPNTIESQPAPSLVSDDGDYDNPHSESETLSLAVASDDEDTLNVEVKDHEPHAVDVDEHGESSTAEFNVGKAHHHAPPPRRRPADALGRRQARKRHGGPRRKSGK